MKRNILLVKNIDGPKVSITAHLFCVAQEIAPLERKFSFVKMPYFLLMSATTYSDVQYISDAPCSKTRDTSFNTLIGV